MTAVRPTAVREVPPHAFTWGAPRGSAAGVAAVEAAAAAHDRVAPLDEATLLRLRYDGLGEGRRLWLAGPLPGDQVEPLEPCHGFALLLDRQVHVVVAPASRGQGMGGALAVAASAAGTDEALTAWSHGDDPAAARLAARLGFERVRELWVMRRPGSLPLPAFALPDGVTLRGYRTADAEALLAVNAAAFEGHPEQGSMDAANLAARMREPWFDPEGLLVAEDERGLLGFHWTKQEPEGDRGEVYVIGLAPRAQGRGLGRVLTLAGLHHLRHRGASEVILHTESDNHRAIALYRRLDFTHGATDTHVMYRRPGESQDSPADRNCSGGGG